MVDIKIALDPDRPISTRKDDQFARARFADVLARQLLSTPVDESFVVSLLGAWGSGKTSILNMVEEALHTEESVKVFKFNPWFFSNTEDLLASFFNELSVQLGKGGDSKLKEIGEVMEKYCEMLKPIKYIPLFGEAAGHAMEAGKNVGEFIGWKAGRKATSIQETKKNVEDALKKTSKRIVVFIDDLDRLAQNEVREIMRLVRLVGDFPNVSYVLAYDQKIIEKSLTDGDIGGHDYLEKIIQVSYHIPALREEELGKFLATELNKVLASFEDGEVNQEDLTNVYHMGIRPLFKSPRDVRRYINALPVAFQTVGDEVSSVDVLALEAIRVLMPSLYVQLADAQELLTSNSSGYESRSSRVELEEEQKKFQTMLDSAGDRKDTTSNLLELIFPACKRITSNTTYGGSYWRKSWRIGRRVAHPEVFSYYLQKSLPDGVLSASFVSNVFGSFGEKEKLEALIGPLNGSELEHLFARLEDYEDKFKFKVADIVIAIQVILNHANQLREERKGMFDFGAEISVGRLNLRLLQSLKDPAERESVVEQVLPQITTLSWKWDLVGMVGFTKGLGHKLVSEEFSKNLESEIVRQIIAAPAEELSKERDLVQLLHLVNGSESLDKAVLWAKFEQPAFFLCFLAKTLSSSRSQSMGQVSVKVTEYLPWKMINEFVGAERVAKYLESLKPDAVFTDKQNKALELAHKYFSGALTERDPRVHMNDGDEV